MPFINDKMPLPVPKVLILLASLPGETHCRGRLVKASFSSRRGKQGVMPEGLKKRGREASKSVSSLTEGEWQEILSWPCGETGRAGLSGSSHEVSGWIHPAEQWGKAVPQRGSSLRRLFRNGGHRGLTWCSGVSGVGRDRGHRGRICALAMYRAHQRQHYLSYPPSQEP